MADWTAEQTAVLDLINEMGQQCRIDKADGTGTATIGVLLSSVSAPTSSSGNGSFVTKGVRTVYVHGKVSAVPKVGDSITFKPNTYAIKEVKAIAIGEGKNNVFAYKLVVTT